jgi:hypothetical protein
VSLRRLALLATLLAHPAWAAAAEERIPPMPVARLAYVTGKVEQQPEGKAWAEAKETSRVSTGDRLRTGPDGTARLEFPWTSLVLGPSSAMSISPTRVLATVLESGRLEQRADAEIMKLQTPDLATVRGKGRLVVRRENGHTAVTVVTGAFRVEAGEAAVLVRAGHGCLVDPGPALSRSVLLPVPAEFRSPGEETAYVKRGEAITLAWRPVGPAHVQILSLDREDVLLERDLDKGTVSIPIPWPGTYRWRVSLRGAQGLESLPSGDGLLCAVDE